MQRAGKVTGRESSLDAMAAAVMADRLLDAGEAVDAGEILTAVRALRKAMAGAGGETGTVRFGSIGRFRLWRDLGGAGVLDTETAGGMRISMDLQLAEGNRIIQSKIPDGDFSWELHDTPGGGAARTQVRLKAAQDGAYIWRDTHYSYGRRWDPTPEKAADNFYREDGSLKCRQRFVQGTARCAGDGPVFEGFHPDGSPKVVEYGDSFVGKHRDPAVGPAYQEFHKGGAPALTVFFVAGKQRGEAHRADGEGRTGGPSGAITNAEAWAAAEDLETKGDDGENRGFGVALVEAARAHARTTKGSRPPGPGGARNGRAR